MATEALRDLAERYSTVEVLPADSDRGKGLSITGANCESLWLSIADARALFEALWLFDRHGLLDD